ncbi:MBL fold metallo-hydrolase [Candidatus Bipolaricaulota bacterium]|nr:MBL fold metallo-hydrolase [Candidatus Bipolaricaulota bacterium]
MRICALGSGSAGNAFLVEAPRGWLLVDAGLPWREIRRRAARIGLHLNPPSTVVITHEHIDHVRGLSTLLRRGAKVWASPGTLRALGIPGHALTGEEEILGLFLRPFRVSHDAAQPLGFRFELDGAAFGLATDLGQVTPEVTSALSGCRFVVLEANHDLSLLLSGPYPWPLKMRILSPKGHLANDETGRVLARLSRDGLRAALLAHLSQENNTPQLALETVARALDGWDGRLYLAYPDRPSAVISL